ncbi:MAG: hypothetical protein MRY32_09435 [Rickettsiales bacterium]|nr:hypothetical protein [Rickettsiales bacterium]
MVSPASIARNNGATGADIASSVCTGDLDSAGHKALEAAQNRAVEKVALAGVSATAKAFPIAGTVADWGEGLYAAGNQVWNGRPGVATAEFVTSFVAGIAANVPGDGGLTSDAVREGSREFFKWAGGEGFEHMSRGNSAEIISAGAILASSCSTNGITYDQNTRGTAPKQVEDTREQQLHVNGI